MPTYTPVDNDPFAQSPSDAKAPAKMTPVEGDPFAEKKGEASMGSRFVAGLEDPFVGTAQLATHVLPSALTEKGHEAYNAIAKEAGLPELPKGGLDELARERDKEYGTKGINWARIAGNVVNPVNWIPAGETARALSLGSKAIPLVEGAVTALSAPTSGNNFWKEKAEQVLGGAAAGKGSEALGKIASSAIAPKLAGAQKALSDLGVQLTPGQMGGRALKRIEDSIASLPLVGNVIRGAQAKSIETFNKAAMNEGLKPIGAELPAGIEAGRPALNFMHKTISDAYDNVLPKMVGHLDGDLQSELSSILSLGKNLPDKERESLNLIVNQDVLPKFSSGGGITGSTVQEIGSELDNLSNTMSRSDSPDTRRLGSAVKEIDASLNRMMERNNPGLYEQKAKIDAAYAHYKTIEKAAGTQGAKEGIFSPAQLSHAIRSRDVSKDKSRYARGSALMQKLSSDAEKVLPQKVPDSGTAERALLAALLSGEYLQNPHVAMALGSLAIPYTQPGLSAARALVNPGTARQSAADLAAVLGADLAPAASQTAIGANK